MISCKETHGDRDQALELTTLLTQSMPWVLSCDERVVMSIELISPKGCRTRVVGRMSSGQVFFRPQKKDFKRVNHTPKRGARGRGGA